MGSLPEGLPATIRDAITVTTKLGYRYLWIDQLCIKQSDPSDLHNHLAKMDLIYSSAIVTIIAASGRDAGSGIPGISVPRLPLCRAMFERADIYVIAHCNSGELLSRSMWSTRGWTYQEGVLSTRRLVFTPWQVMFECQTSTWNESLNMDLHASSDARTAMFESLKSPRTFGAYRGVDLSSMGAFFRHMEKYSRRQLSDEADALKGVQGVLSLARRLGIPSHWGLPTKTIHDFAKGLLWNPNYNSLVEHGSRRKGFPSWSWCDWIGGVDYMVHGKYCCEELRIEFQRFDGTFTDPSATFSSDNISQPVNRPLETSPATLSIRIEAVVYDFEDFVQKGIRSIATDDQLQEHLFRWPSTSFYGD